MTNKNLNKLKETLYSQIEQINNETTLLMLQEAVAEYSSNSIDDGNQLTTAQQQRLEESIKQAQEGRTISHEEVLKKVDQWLSR